jgi:hypothetical protein
LVAAARRGLGPHFRAPTPPGLLVGGTSTYYRAKGPNEPAQWIKTRTEAARLEAVQATIREAFEEWRDVRVWVPEPPKIFEADLMSVYPLVDLHLGQYSWREETGSDYDLYIARDTLNGVMGELVAETPRSDLAILLNVGDFFHSDSNENRTRRSGNVLDVDTRYAKVLKFGVQLIIGLAQLLAQRHKRVLIRNLPGNHDPYASLALNVAVESYFAGSERITVDPNWPSPFFWYKHGKVLIGSTHGDMARAEDMPGIMAAKVPEMWGETEFRYVYMGHLHTAKRKLVSETNGAEVEVFQTIAPRDAWGNATGYVSGRGVTSITHHRDLGERYRFRVPVKGPR